MLKPFVLAALVVLVGAAHEFLRTTTIAKVVTLRCGEWWPATQPWMAMVDFIYKRTNRTSSCSGVILSNQLILTAAHCIRKDLIYDRAELRIGTRNLLVHGRNEIILPVLSEQPEYGFVLVKAARAFSHFRETVQPICLPLYCDNSSFVECDDVVIAAYGYSQKLKQSSGSIFPTANCSQALGTSINSSTAFCVQPTNKTILQAIGNGSGAVLCNIDRIFYLLGVISSVGTTQPIVANRICPVKAWLLQNGVAEPPEPIRSIDETSRASSTLTTAALPAKTPTTAIVSTLLRGSTIDSIGSTQSSATTTSLIPAATTLSSNNCVCFTTTRARGGTGADLPIWRPALTNCGSPTTLDWFITGIIRDDDDADVIFTVRPNMDRRGFSGPVAAIPLRMSFRPSRREPASSSTGPRSSTSSIPTTYTRLICSSTTTERTTTTTKAICICPPTTTLSTTSETITLGDQN